MKPETKKTIFNCLFIAGLIFIFIMIWAGTNKKCGLKGLGDWAGFITFSVIVSIVFAGIFLFFAAFAREVWRELKENIIKEEEERREKEFQEHCNKTDSNTLKELKKYLHRKQKDDEYASWRYCTFEDLDEYLERKRKEENDVCSQLREKEKKRKENVERNKLLSEQIHKLPIAYSSESIVVYCDGTYHWCESDTGDIWRENCQNNKLPCLARSAKNEGEVKKKPETKKTIFHWLAFLVSLFLYGICLDVKYGRGYGNWMKTAIVTLVFVGVFFVLLWITPKSWKTPDKRINEDEYIAREAQKWWDSNPKEFMDAVEKKAKELDQKQKEIEEKSKSEGEARNDDNKNLES